jgi:hypothetical protein
MKGQITINEFPKLKNAYNKAAENKIEQFEFNDTVLLTNYAKYLI